MKKYLRIKHLESNGNTTDIYVRKESITRYVSIPAAKGTDSLNNSQGSLVINFPDSADGGPEGLYQITCAANDSSSSTLLNPEWQLEVEVNEFHRIKRELDELVSMDM